MERTGCVCGCRRHRRVAYVRGVSSGTPGGLNTSWSGLLLLPLLLLQLTASTASALRIKEYCETELLNATCSHPDDVILMRHARYGRMRMGRCVKLDYGHVGCSSDVLDLADSRCSGRKQCIIRIPDALFAQTKPCPDDLKPYMEATFECVRVVMPTEQTCSRSSSLVSSSPTGYLSSIVSAETGCGRRDTPWTLSVKPGQRINISLYDFSAAADAAMSLATSPGENDVAASATGARSLTQCRVYAVIRERTVHRMRNITVCGTKSRERNVYISLTNTVEIGLLVNSGPRDKDKTQPFFLVKYEAVGCPDLEAGDHSWIMRKQNDVILGCNHTSESWHLKCEGTEWVGKSGNCSIHSAAVPNRNHKDDKPLSYGLSLSGSSILIIIAVALTIGVVVLAAGLLCLRKQRARFCGTADVASPEESDGEEEKTYVDRNYFHYGWTQKSEASSPNKEPGVGVVRPAGMVNEYGQIAGTQPCTPLLKKENRPTIYGPALPPCTCSHLTPSLYRLEGTARGGTAGRGGCLEGQMDAEPFIAGSNPEQHQHYFVLDPDVLGGTRTYGRLAPKGKSGLGTSGRGGKPQEEIYQLRTLKPMVPLSEMDKNGALCDCHKQFMEQEQHQHPKPAAAVQPGLVGAKPPLQQTQPHQPQNAAKPPPGPNPQPINPQLLQQQQQPQLRQQQQQQQQQLHPQPQRQQQQRQGPMTAPKPTVASVQGANNALLGGAGMPLAAGVVGAGSGLPTNCAYGGNNNEYVDNDVNERRGASGVSGGAADTRHAD